MMSPLYFLRRTAALFICPELTPSKVAKVQEPLNLQSAGNHPTDSQSILMLGKALAAHQSVSHYAISMRIFKKGDFFKKLIDGGDCRTATVARALTWFDANWPADLEWPRDIPRPPKSKKEAA